ncbi:hypothetical protein OnM2_025005 [Erysiphe neolycopersici]|uniref:Uncharacterized protein n=1 Tax=Erysiphe neolycopersici TaxID=212602 RepID=A0A420I1J3_9PEZI|nr:hypothetical protein OnM2_025005 [Erysiphe neolycopersici]
MTLSSHVEDNRHETTNSSSFPPQKLLSEGKKDHDKEYTSFDGDFIPLDMQNLPVYRPVRKQPLRIPILPQRNVLRTAVRSKKESSNPQEEMLAKHKEFYTTPILSSSDLHDVYLSSEEDISVKDSNEDLLFDSDDSEKDLNLESYDRESQEITARAVSFRVAGKPQIIEISCHSNKSSPRTSTSISDRSPHRPLFPRLPALSLTLSDFHLDAHELFPSSPPTSSPPSLSTQKPADSLQSNALVKAKICKSSSDSLQSKPVIDPSTTLSIFRRGSLLNRRSQITQSIIQMSNHVTKNSPTTTSKISGRLNALKYVSRNIKNTGLPKISLAYTPGVVPRRT